MRSKRPGASATDDPTCTFSSNKGMDFLKIYHDPTQKTQGPSGFALLTCFVLFVFQGCWLIVDRLMLNLKSEIPTTGFATIHNDDDDGGGGEDD